jgi:alpha-L-rhamnosidase
VFDVGHLLRKFQRNALAAVCFSTGENRDFMAELRVFYPDGTMDIFGTDAGWRCLSADPYYNMGPRFSGYYTAGPENIDARQEPVGWRSPIFKDDSWAPVRVLKPYSERLVAQPMRNIEIRGVAPVVGRVKGPGHVFLDFGREIVGSLRLEIDGEDGHPVEVRLGEELSGPMTVRHATRTGVNYVETWTLREGPQLIENFGYRGFRYAELLNLPDTDLMVSAVALAYPFEEDAAAFECSDPGLNRVWALCHYSIQATNLDVYQDCPTRERGPYEGDAYINMLSHYATDREFAFARYSNEYLYHRPTWPTEYKQTCLLMAWADYMATGDAKALAAQYETLCTKTLLDQVNAQGLVEREDTRDNRALVDWPPPYRDGYEFTTVNTVTNSFHCRAVEILADIAGVLGKTEDQARFAAAAERTRAAMTRHLFDADAGVYRDGQNSDHRAAHANFFPLALGLTPPEHRASVADYLIERGMACSVYGAQFLLDALYNAGRGDAALALMTATDTHSWLHMIDDLGATITTEAWDPAGKSNMSVAHPWATAPVNIIPRRLFGIEPLEPGYGRVRIRPQTGGLEWGRLTLPTIRGPIQVAFRDGAKAFKLEVTLPANTSAEVHLPVRAGATSGVVLDGQAVPTVLVDGYRVVERVGAGPRKLVIR